MIAFLIARRRSTRSGTSRLAKLSSSAEKDRMSQNALRRTRSLARTPLRISLMVSSPTSTAATLTSQSVLFETSLGDIIVRTYLPPAPLIQPQVDLDTSLCPITSLNFLKLAKTYSYNFCSFHNVIKDFIAQTGSPTDDPNTGSSIFNRLPRSSKDYSPAPYFPPELSKKLKHGAVGTLSMAIAGEGDQRGCGSQFFFTLGGDLEYLDGKHAPFGRVVEGEDTLAKINEVFTDGDGKPLRDIRIRHVIILGTSLPLPPATNLEKQTTPSQTRTVSSCSPTLPFQQQPNSLPCA